jgi:hypothetical protein
MNAEEMNAEETPDLEWTAAEENLLLVARELEWAEAYAADHPKCRMGRLYLDFLHWELVAAQSGV